MTDQEEAAKEAAMRIMLRGVAPDLKLLFDLSAKEWNEEIEDNIYMAVRFESGIDVSDPNSCIVTMNSKQSKKQRSFRKGESKQMDSMFEFFPYMGEIFNNYAEAWQLTLYDLFLTARYKNLELATDDPANALSLAIHTKKSLPKEQQRNQKII